MLSLIILTASSSLNSIMAYRYLMQVVGLLIGPSEAKGTKSVLGNPCLVKMQFCWMQVHCLYTEIHFYVL